MSRSCPRDTQCKGLFRDARVERGCSKARAEEEGTHRACRVTCPARSYSICTIPLRYSSISAASSPLLRLPHAPSLKLPSRLASPLPCPGLPSPLFPPLPRPRHSPPQNASSQIIAASDAEMPENGFGDLVARFGALSPNKKWDATPILGSANDPQIRTSDGKHHTTRSQDVVVVCPTPKDGSYPAHFAAVGAINTTLVCKQA